MWLDKPEKTRKIIVDVDAGIDDTWALLFLLKAMDSQLCDIKAITCVHGNTRLENVVRNVLRILKTMGKEKEIPVYKGCAEPLLICRDEAVLEKEKVHGSDGFGNVKFDDEVDLSLVQSKHAVNAIADIVAEHSKEIELVFLGPLTNLAVAIRMFGAEFVNNIKEMHIMGGNYMGIGNVTKSAEFNFFSDPEAVHIVLDTLTCPITILPWETCTEKAGMTIPVQWRLDELGSIENHITKLMNALDHTYYVARSKTYFRPCDALLAAVFLCPELVEVAAEWHANVELQGQHTRGQLVLDHLKSRTNNVKIVEKINMELFKKMCLWVVGHPNHVCIRCKE